MAYIYDEGAYEAGIKRRIKANIAKGFAMGEAAWLAGDSSRAALSEEILNSTASTATFIGKMRDQLIIYGCLTEKQENAVVKMFAEQQARAEESKSTHIGTVGARQEFRATVSHVIETCSIYGNSCIVIMASGENVIVYKGNSLNPINRVVQKGDQVAFVATIKSHSEYNGINQTIVARPKLI